MAGKRKRSYRSVVMQCLLSMPTLTILLSFVCAKLIVSEILKEESLQMCVVAIVGFVAFGGSLYCAIRMPQKKAMWGLGTAVVYFVMLFLGNLLFFGLGYGEIMSVLICVLTGGILGSLIGALKRRKYA